MNTTNTTEPYAQAILSWRIIHTLCYSAYITGYSLTLIAVLLLRKRQPVKSRIPTSPLTLICFLMNNIGQIIQIWLYTYGFIVLIIVAPLLILMGLILLLQQLYFVLTLHANDLKQAQAQGTDVSKGAVRAIRFITARPLTVVLVLFVAVEQIGITIPTVVLTLMGKIDDSVQTNWTTGNLLGHCALFIIGLVIVVIADIVVDIRRYGCFNGYLTTRDVLKFRLDMIFIVFAILFQGLSSAMSSIRSATLQAQIYESAQTVVLAYLTTALSILGFVFIQLVSGGTVVIVALRNMRKETNKEEETDPMIRMIQDKKGQKIFEEYCKHEFSSENLLAFYMIQEILEKKEIEKKRKSSLQLIDQYVKEGALSEVNLPKTVRQSLLNSTEKIKEMSEDEIERLFKDLGNEVKHNLNDTFKRLRLTPQYKKYAQIK
jgi:hypothetical protein